MQCLRGYILMWCVSAQAKYGRNAFELSLSVSMIQNVKALCFVSPSLQQVSLAQPITYWCYLSRAGHVGVLDLQLRASGLAACTLQQGEKWS